MDDVFFIFDPLVLVGGPPKPQKSLFNVPSLHCYGWLTPKACNKGIVRVVAAM